jgi:hypothetical protein
MNTQDIKTAVSDLLAAKGITIKTVFVPWSQSRNKNEKNPSFNYLVTVLKNGREVLTTDYMMGCAHSPSYKKIKSNTVHGKNHITQECEKGYQLIDSPSGFFYPVNGMSKKYILPDITDIFYSLMLDSDVLDAGCFEDWANNFGYDKDSRAAEKIHRQCIDIALKLRVAIPDTLRAELQELLQDY